MIEMKTIWLFLYAETSQSGTLSDSSLNGWICLMNIMTRLFVHTHSETCKLFFFVIHSFFHHSLFIIFHWMSFHCGLLIGSSLKHIPSIRLFLLWMELQKPDGYRPKVFNLIIISLSPSSIWCLKYPWTHPPCTLYSWM